MFLTSNGLPYIGPKGSTVEKLAAGRLDNLGRRNSLGEIFDWTLTRLGMKRKGLSFYSLRHTFRTIGDAAKDQNAIKLIMGHSVKGVEATYLHDIDNDRLRVVTDRVHAWLFPANNSTEKKGP